MSDRLIDRVLDPQFVSGLGDLSPDEIQGRIDEASEIERQVSAQRRTLHRIIDELATELAARSS